MAFEFWHAQPSELEKAMREIETGLTKARPEIQTGVKKALPEVAGKTAAGLVAVLSSLPFAVSQAFTGLAKSVPGITGGVARAIPEVRKGTSESMKTLMGAVPSGVPSTPPEKYYYGAPSAWGRLMQKIFPPKELIKEVPYEIEKERMGRALKEEPLREVPAAAVSKKAKKEIVKEKREVEKKEPEKEPEPEKTVLDAIRAERDKRWAETEEIRNFYEALMKGGESVIKSKRKELDSLMTELGDFTKETKDKLTENTQKLKEEIKKPLPSPPGEEEVITPKNKILAIIKAIVPVVIGINAVLRPGRYGENIYYFNAMHDAIKASDAEAFAKALDAWKRNFEIGRMEKENAIKSLEIERSQIMADYTLSAETKKLAISQIEKEIEIAEEQIKTASDAYDKIVKELNEYEKILRDEMKLLNQIRYYNERLRVEERRLEEEKRYHDIMAKIREWTAEIAMMKTPQELYEWVKAGGKGKTQEEAEKEQKARMSFIQALKRPEFEFLSGLTGETEAGIQPAPGKEPIDTRMRK